MSETKKAHPGTAIPGQAVENGSVCETAHASIKNDITLSSGGQRFRVADLLLHGAENAISRRDLMKLTALSDRALRLLIEAERREGVPILSDNIHGYFLPGSETERARCVRSLRRRAEEIVKTAEAIESSEGCCKKYGVDKSDYDRCYDVFGTLRNKEYLKQIQAAHKAQKQSERSYRERWRGTYERYTSGSYSVPSVSTYTESETAILRQFYRSLSKIYHPDLNPGRDTTAEMQSLNKLKEAWGV